MTTDNLFAAVLTFAVLAGAPVVFGNHVLERNHAPVAAETATLPTVTVVGRRVAAADSVTLPTVTVVGRRATPTQVAALTTTPAQRVQ